MLCADGLAASRSTLHFLTFAHTRAKHIFLPSECGPGTYARGSRVPRDKGPRKKPNPNNATLLCIENPDTEVRVTFRDNETRRCGPVDEEERRSIVSAACRLKALPDARPAGGVWTRRHHTCRRQKEHQQRVIIIRFHPSRSLPRMF